MALRRRKPNIHKDRIYLGRMSKPHALQGELKYQAFGSDPWLLEELQTIHLENPDTTFEVEYVRGSFDSPIVKLKTIDNRDKSEDLVGALVWIDPELLPTLEDDTYYESDSLFSRVVTVNGKDLGRVESIIETGECDVLVVRDSHGHEWLIPANRAIVKEVRREEATIIVDPPADLLSLGNDPDSNED